MRLPETRARRYVRAARPRRIHLTERDIAVLRALAVHRILSADQLQRLVLRCSASRVRRRLRALYDHELIDRLSVIAQPTAGVPPVVYVLGAAGNAILAERGLAAAGTFTAPPGPAFIRHRYLVNDFYVKLVAAIRSSPYRLREWRHEQQLKLPGVDGRGAVERVAHPTLPEPMPFLPDAYFQLHLDGTGLLAFFVEIDCSTASQGTWRQRALLYRAYADPAAGLFRQRFGRETFRVLIQTPREYRRRSRCNNILATIQRTIGETDLFLAAPLNEVTTDRMLAAIWRRPGADERVSLTNNPAAGGAVRVRPVPRASDVAMRVREISRDRAVGNRG